MAAAQQPQDQPEPEQGPPPRWAQGRVQPDEAPQEPQAEPENEARAAPGRAPRPHYDDGRRNRLTTLGVLKAIKAPGADYLEWWYLRFLHWCLTERWAVLQGGWDISAS